MATVIKKKNRATSLFCVMKEKKGRNNENNTNSGAINDTNDDGSINKKNDKR